MTKGQKNKERSTTVKKRVMIVHTLVMIESMFTTKTSYSDAVEIIGYAWRAGERTIRRALEEFHLTIVDMEIDLQQVINTSKKQVSTQQDAMFELKTAYIRKPRPLGQGPVTYLL
jgi:hypothetical protein